MKTAASYAVSRLAATAMTDFRLQLRNGFYVATGFVLAMTGALIWFAAQHIEPGWIMPAIVVNNLMITAFYFIAALVLLEKAEGSLAARAATPLRPGEYLWAKVITLGMLALLQNMTLAFLACGVRVNGTLLAIGISLAAAQLVLVGFAAVVRYTSLNAYLFPSLSIAALLMIPLLPYTLGWEHPLLYIHPLQAPLVLMRAALTPQPVWHSIYGLLYGICGVIVSFLLARRSWQQIQGV